MNYQSTETNVRTTIIYEQLAMPLSLVLEVTKTVRKQDNKKKMSEQ